MYFQLFKNKKDRHRFVKIKQVINIADNTVNLVFEKQKSFNYQPGQFITIIKDINGKKTKRAYSLCSTPFEDDEPVVTVKRVANGLMSNYLNDHIKSGDVLEIMEPTGQFVTTYDVLNNRHAVFFGGGSGITPLISIIRSVLLKEPKSRVDLVYANKNPSTIIFKKLIDDLSQKHANRFNVIHILEDGQGDYQGMPTHSMIEKIIKKISCNNKTQFFICGPQPLMDLIVAKLTHYPKENIHLESFFSATKTEKNKTATGGISNVTMIINGERHTLNVPKNKSILEHFLENGIDVSYSCQNGICTACRGKCLEGKVSIDKAEGLSEEEKTEGYVLTCVGTPLSEKIILEMD